MSLQGSSGPAGTSAVVPDERELRACCAADAWVHRLSAAWTTSSPRELLDLSDETVLALDDTALDQALAAHPRIGERRLGSTPEDRWSRTEQAGALASGDDVTARLAEGNHRYEERFGHVFLIRAAGRTGEEMLAALEERLGNDLAAERQVVRRELAEIVRLRLLRLLQPPPPEEGR